MIKKITKIIINIFSNIKYTGKFQLHLQKIKYEEIKIKNVNNTTLCNEIINIKKKIKGKNLQNEDKYRIFSLIKKAAKETLNITIYDVQLYAGWILIEKNIIEMKTGEGKTVVAVFPTVINFILGKKTHIATTNNYLAKRDMKWMQPLYNLLGIKITYNTNKMDIKKKIKAYRRDVVYSTCSEFIFDYLKSNTTLKKNHYIHNPFDLIIVDEIDAILIDEARTPLIITNQKTASLTIVKKNFYYNINSIIKMFIKLNRKKNLIIINKKKKEISLTDLGYEEIESICKKNKFIKKEENLYGKKTANYIINIFLNALKANILFKKNVDYIVKNKKILIIDENTGRLLDDRRWAEGLHQAIEAKENLAILPITESSATITFQSFIKLYKKICGMTGTAKTEETELQAIYNLNVVQIPPNKKCRRFECIDLVYITKEEKFKRIIADINFWHKKKRPILLGTTSVETSNYTSNLLKKFLIKHNLLNANYSIKEANIIAVAGMHSTITVATNIAGRGTDILLGGSITYLLVKFSFNFTKENIYFITNQIYLKIKYIGGLYIIGTERYNLRRIDDQLKGRCARQGDPGGIQFYLCLEDNLLKSFLYSVHKDFLKNFTLIYTYAISYKILDTLIKKAQTHYEKHNSTIRKHLTEFDEVLNEQRTILYNKRKKILLNYKKKKDNYYNTQHSKELLLCIYNECWKKHLKDLELIKNTTYLQCFIGKKPLDHYRKESYKLFLILLKKIKISQKYLTLNLIKNIRIKLITI